MCRNLAAVAMTGLLLVFPMNLSAIDADNEPVTAADGGIPTETWPESWFQAPRTASELGIVEFRQSPVLDKQVAAGELPPVSERLPDDPIVIEPFDEIGVHGGTASIFDIGLTLFNPPEGPYRAYRAPARSRSFSGTCCHPSSVT